MLGRAGQTGRDGAFNRAELAPGPEACLQLRGRASDWPGTGQGPGGQGSGRLSLVESSGSIETVCNSPGAKVGDTLKLVFRALDDSEPPYTVKIISPAGKVVVERVLRELPTGRPQSAPPLTFTAPAEGDYKVEIWQLYGKSRGQATLRVAAVDAG